MDAKVAKKRLKEPHGRQTEPKFPKEAPSLSENIGLNSQAELRIELEQSWKLRHTAQSEGYETMTQHSSEDMSDLVSYESFLKQASRLQKTQRGQ